jgi:hypothetical protein
MTQPEPLWTSTGTHILVQPFEEALEDNGFKVSSFDPCMFYGQGMVVLDDCLFFGPDLGAIDGFIGELEQQGFALTKEEDIYAFLGIQLDHNSSTGTYTLSQERLIKKVLKTTGMEDCNSKSSAARVAPLGIDADGAPFSEKWNHAPVIGMLLYLSSNSRPDIQFAVHQCARFTYNPRAITLRE